MRIYTSIHQAKLRQRGAAAILFIILAALGLVAITGRALDAISGGQTLQYTEHIATQAELAAWTGVSVVSSAVAALTPAQVLLLTPNSVVTLSGVQKEISAKYINSENGYLIFEVTGTSGGAKSVLKAAYAPPAGSATNTYSGITFTGMTTLNGSVNYQGTNVQSISVLDGSLTLSGSVTGLKSVCATGDVTINSNISVDTVCSNQSVTLGAAAQVTNINAIGNVFLIGGAAGAIGTINSNGNLVISGGSAKATTANITGNVTVSGGDASVGTVNTEGNVKWTSTATVSTIKANGAVEYATTANTSAANISAIGNVRISAAHDVSTKGTTTLTGYYGQGISGTLKSQGLLGGASWGASGGAVVASGTVGSIASPYPKSVNVTVTSGYSVPINTISISPVPVFSASSLSVDAYKLQTSANFKFMGVDSSGNPMVKAQSLLDIPDGDYFIAASPSGGENYLCAAVSGTTCKTPLMKVCDGYSMYNKCFSYDKTTSNWKIEGNAMVPTVLWFQGNLIISNGKWVNTFIATGDVTTSGSVVVYAPNYPLSQFTCRGQADSTHGLSALSANGLSAAHYPTQLCSATASLAADIGNIALAAGGYKNSVFVGGNINLGTLNNIYGAVLAGQYFNSSGDTTVAGPIWAGRQNISVAGSNSQGSSTTIIDGNGSADYTPGKTPCMVNCGSGGGAGGGKTNNIAWVGSA